MTAQRNVIVVERVRGRAIDPGGLRYRHAWADQIKGGIAGRGRERFVQEARWLFDAACDQRADAVDKTGVHHAQGRRWYGLKPDA